MRRAASQLHTCALVSGWHGTSALDVSFSLTARKASLSHGPELRDFLRAPGEPSTVDTEARQVMTLRGILLRKLLNRDER